MNIRLGAMVLLAVLASSSVRCEDVETITIKNAGLMRTVSGTVGLLKTSKLEAKGRQLLKSPSVEFMIEIEHNGENMILVPGDFEIKGVSESKKNRETQTSLRLDSIREGAPLRIYVNYFADSKAEFQQKSISIAPCGKLTGAVIRRVVVEDMLFANTFAPTSPVDRFAAGPELDLTDIGSRFRFDQKSNFAAIDRKAKLGLYFFMSSVSGREEFSSRGRLVMWEEPDALLEEGHETGRATIGVATGTPEAVYARFRKFLWDHYCVMREKDGSKNRETRVISGNGTGEVISECRKLRKLSPQPLIRMAARPNAIPLEAHLLSVVDQIQLPGLGLARRQWRYALGFVLPAGAMNADGQLEGTDLPLPTDKYGAFRKRFGPFLDVYQHVLDFPDGDHVDGEAHIVDNKGFIVLYNPTGEAKKIALPLDESGLDLRGKVRLSDWTDLDAPKSLGEAEVRGTFEIELQPKSVGIVGLNIDDLRPV